MLHKRKKEKKSKKGKGGKREGKHGAKSVINSGKDVCVRYGAVTLMRGDAGVKIIGREHCADVILSKGCTEPTARAIIQTPCSGGHLHNFMGLHARFSSALAPRP